MHILHITPHQPLLYSGGGLAVFQTIKSLKSNGYNVDYIGEPIENQDISCMYDKKYYLGVNNNVLLRFWDTIHGHTNSRYREWLKLQIDFDFYDVIILEFTKLDYVIDRIGNKKLIVKAHNVEYDYSLVDYNTSHTAKKYLIHQLSFKQEKRILNRADVIVTLTQKDKERLSSLYGIEDIGNFLDPICVSPQMNTIRPKSSTLKLLITGSLWFGANVDGIIWFLDSVLSKIDFPFELKIAGRNPNDYLIKHIKKHENVSIISSPDSMYELFDWCDVVIVPIFEGSGMKVKTAEAMSYSKPVIGTSHAFEGYEINDGVNGFIADDATIFIQKLNNVFEMNNSDWITICNNVRILFNLNYSDECGSRNWKNIIDSIG